MNPQKLPNATTVLILGIVSIVTCCCYGIPSLITGFIALNLAKKDEALYLANPQMYSDYNNLKTGKTLAYVGIVLGVLYLVYMIFLIATVGFDAMTDPALMQERINDMLGK